LHSESGWHPFQEKTTTPLYLCRWPNGDLSAVSAANKQEAIFALDEVGDAQADLLVSCPTFMLHLSLTDTVTPEDVGDLSNVLEVESFGEQCRAKRWDAYPELNGVASEMDDEDVQRTEAEWQALVDAALARESTRLGPEPATPEEEAETIRRIVEVRAARGEG
jgi:hypothetical protein